MRHKRGIRMATRPARLKSIYDLEDALFKQYSETVSQTDPMSIDELTEKHDRARFVALDNFDHHPQLKKFKSKLVNTSRVNLIQRIEQEHKRVFEMNEERLACLETSVPPEQQASTERVLQNDLDELKAQELKMQANTAQVSALHSQGSASQQTNADHVAKVEELKAEIDSLLRENDELDAKRKVILSRISTHPDEDTISMQQPKKKNFLKTMYKKMGRSYYCYYYSKQPHDENDVYIKSSGSKDETIFDNSPGPALEFISDSTSETSTAPKSLYSDTPDATRESQHYQEREVITPPAGNTLVKTFILNADTSVDSSQQTDQSVSVNITPQGDKNGAKTNEQYQESHEDTTASILRERDEKTPGNIQAERYSVTSEESVAYKDADRKQMKSITEFNERKVGTKDFKNTKEIKKSDPVMNSTNDKVTIEKILLETVFSAENGVEQDKNSDNNQASDESETPKSGSLRREGRKQDMAASIIQEKVRASRASSLSNIFADLEISMTEANPAVTQNNPPRRKSTDSLTNNKFKFIDAEKTKKLAEIEHEKESNKSVSDNEISSKPVMRTQQNTKRDEYKTRSLSREEMKFNSWAKMLARKSLVNIEINSNESNKSDDHSYLSQTIHNVSPQVGGTAETKDHLDVNKKGNLTTELQDLLRNLEPSLV
ncbi:hypothetical protein B566_EDAN001645 [Ephemera danica]|nr:hypothetical protein B566_EDAN001645 [Ephemera danica]